MRAVAITSIAIIALLAIGLLGAGAATEEIGTATLVKPKVRGFPPGGLGYDLVTRSPIERGMSVVLTGKDALLEVAFNRSFGCKPSTPDDRRVSGVLKIQGTSDAELGDPKRSCVAKVQLSAGKFRFILLKGEPPIVVDTPEAVSGVNGTIVRFLVHPLVGTFVAVDEGVVSVQARVGGDPVEVEAGQWVVVPPGGLPTRPAPTNRLDNLNILSDPPLSLRDFTTGPPRPPQ